MKNRDAIVSSTLGFVAIAAVSAMLGCMKPGDGVGLNSQGHFLPPAFAYTTPVSDSFGIVASHTPVLTSTSGPVTSYSVSPALPAGLSINAVSGVISGTPSAVSLARDYTVTASGQGGAAVAVINIEVPDPCILNPNLPRCNTKPEFSYASPVFDTLNMAVYHPPVSDSTGGRIFTYALTGSALPTGLVLDTGTGVISGTPTVVTAVAAYTILATGPGGMDTAVINIRTDGRCVYNPNFNTCPLPANFFAANIQTIFTNNCITCHQPGGQGYLNTGSGLDLRSGNAYDSLVNHPAYEFTPPEQMMRVLAPIVLTDNIFMSDSSYMYLKISTSGGPTVGNVHTQMPLGGPYLNAFQISQVKKWIDHGAPRN